jgi:glycerophosphoryl diester phosphodiesterase
LQEALVACAPLAVNVEIKPDGVAALQPQLIEAVVELLLSYDGTREFLVTSFDHDIVDRVRGLAPSIPTGLLNADGAAVDVDLDRAAAGGHVAINPWHGFVDRMFVERAHSLGIAVNVWTVDDPALMRALSQAGVDAIITNVPRLCREVLSEN